MTEMDQTIKPKLNPEKWVKDYGNYLYNYALGRVRNHTEAENLVQETFLAAVKSRVNFKGNSTERTWLTGILKHKIIDFFRTRYREQPVTDLSREEQAVNDFFDHTNHLKNTPKDWIPDPEGLATNKEFWQTFAQCRDKLPELTAEAFTLREIEQMDSKEICETLGITKANFWVLLHRARLSLRECLEQNWFT